MKPFNIGDRVVSIKNSEVVYTVRACGEINNTWYMTFDGGASGYGGIQKCHLFIKVSDYRRYRINKLNLD